MPESSFACPLLPRSKLAAGVSVAPATASFSPSPLQSPVSSVFEAASDVSGSPAGDGIFCDLVAASVACLTLARSSSYSFGSELCDGAVPHLLSLLFLLRPLVPESTHCISFLFHWERS